MGGTAKTIEEPFPSWGRKSLLSRFAGGRKDVAQ